MAYLGVDINGKEFICNSEAIKEGNDWVILDPSDIFIDLPNGSIKKLIGHDITFNDGLIKLE